MWKKRGRDEFAAIGKLKGGARIFPKNEFFLGSQIKTTPIQFPIVSRFGIQLIWRGYITLLEPSNMFEN